MTERPRRPTITDVAALAGVSRTAVSKVFNDHGSISLATEARIREAARKLQWTPSATAIALRSARSWTVGLILHRPGLEPDDDPRLPVSLIAGLEPVLASSGYGLLLQTTAEEREQAQTYRRLAEAKRVDGVVLVDSMIGDTRFELARELGLPAVLVGTPWREDPIAYLGHGTHGAGMPEAAEHLVALGHRRIAYIDGPEHQVDARDRAQALAAALTRHAIRLVAHTTGPYSPSSAAVRTAELLDRWPDVTAILYGEDTMALAGMHVLWSRGLRVPEDVSVIGYNGIEVGEWVQPQLTTVRRDSVQRGRAAAVVLLRLLGQHVEQEYLVEEPALVVRSSTGPVRAG